MWTIFLHSLRRLGRVAFSFFQLLFLSCQLSNISFLLLWFLSKIMQILCQYLLIIVYCVGLQAKHFKSKGNFCITWLTVKWVFREYKVLMTLWITIGTVKADNNKIVRNPKWLNGVGIIKDICFQNYPCICNRAQRRNWKECVLLVTRRFMLDYF